MAKNIDKIFNKQRDFFNSGKTLTYNFRLEQLKILKKMLIENEEDIYKALYMDLNKSSFESYETELGLLLSAINYAIKNLKKWMKTKKVSSPISNFPSKSYIVPEPYGISLIISPWNYPILLTLEPLIGSISGGNTTIIKPSEYSMNVSNLLDKLINIYFDESYICVIKGEVKESQELLEKNFDYIFFTGSPRVGKIVMEKASKNLTPVTLELGGKSPCIVDKTCDIDLASKRITWGKLINSGQTCVAPDYILVDEEIEDELIRGIEKYIRIFYGENPLENNEYPKIINRKHFDRLLGYLDEYGLLEENMYDENKLKIIPTIVNHPKLDSKLMNEEIFGPILPVISYKSLNEAYDYVKKDKKPLAAYIFTNSKENKDRFLRELHFGGGAINDTLVHLATNNLPFGGVQNSGMGSYHGKYSFDTFTHYKSIVKKGNFLDINLRYHPGKGKLGKLKKILK